MYANFYLVRTKLLAISTSTRKFNREDIIYECVLILEKEDVELSNTYGCCLLVWLDLDRKSEA